jgi:hypothetical protein
MTKLAARLNRRRRPVPIWADPGLVQSRVSPGIYTAALLYVPFSSWALVGAARDGVARTAIATAMVAGTLMMASVVFGSEMAQQRKLWRVARDGTFPIAANHFAALNGLFPLAASKAS